VVYLTVAVTAILKGKSVLTMEFLGPLATNLKGFTHPTIFSGVRGFDGRWRDRASDTVRGL
jgi:hypothetical protein